MCHFDLTSGVCMMMVMVMTMIIMIITKVDEDDNGEDSGEGFCTANCISAFSPTDSVIASSLEEKRRNGHKPTCMQTLLSSRDTCPPEGSLLLL